MPKKVHFPDKKKTTQDRYQADVVGVSGYLSDIGSIIFTVLIIDNNHNIMFHESYVYMDLFVKCISSQIPYTL